MNFQLKKYTTLHSPGYVIEIFNNSKITQIVYGNSQTKPNIKKCNQDTLYDIASLTKVYTATLIYIAYEEKKIDIYNYVKNIDERFTNLSEVTVLDLLSHNQEIWTQGYLGTAKNKPEFYKILFSSTVKSKIPTYVDTHYIILSTLLEKIYNQPYEELLKEKIFTKLNLKHTTLNPRGNNIASNNYEKNEGQIIDCIPPGTIHDKKARKAKELGLTIGNASIFTTAHDLLLFLKSFLDNSLLKKETITFMLKHTDIDKLNFKILSNLVKENNINIMYEEALEKNENLKLCHSYNYMGTRFSNAITAINDIPSLCSKNTISFSGYTGPSFIIDFDNKIIIVIMCNVIHNSKLNRFERRTITKEIINHICDFIYKSQ